jgi:hypothetical protein
MDQGRMDDVIRDTTLRRLKQFAGHRVKTAASLGIGVRTLGMWLKKWTSEGLMPVFLLTDDTPPKQETSVEIGKTRLATNQDLFEHIKTEFGVKGMLARCSRGALGLIMEDEPQQVKYGDKNTGIAFVGIHLTDKISPVGSPWCSRRPTIVGHVKFMGG